MTVSEVRKRYLDFFARRGHKIIPSAPIVPENDPTTLFTSSGMQPLVPYLLGKDHPEGKRIANSQMSFRAEDIEEVGDNRHTTFFEMLGNWSLGDYFKAEQLPWIFEYLTSKNEGLGFDPNKLYVTVFDGDKDAGMDLDQESVDIWQTLYKEKGINAKLVRIGTENEGYANGMQDGRIFAYGSKKNWWSRSGVPSKMPPGEPGGPDSEVFYDFGTPHDTKWGLHCHVNCDCGRFVEICNSVFMQFVKQSDGTFVELPKKNVDFGGGLERFVMAVNDDPDIFKIDVFRKTISALEEKSGKQYDDPEFTRDFRIIADHIRAVTFLVAAGVSPGPKERGSVIRKLMLRTISSARRLGIKDLFESGVRTVIEEYKDAYPYLNSFDATNLIESEENRLRVVDETGKQQILNYRRDHPDAIVLPASIVTRIQTSQGTPISSIAALSAGAGFKMPSQGELDREFDKHREVSKAGAAQKFAGGLADHQAQTIRYHTAHHLLLKALQIVLGKEVHQRGSNITSERLRIDFSHDSKLTKEQIAEVEQIVNEKIKEALPVTRTVMHRDEAEKLGAEHEFGTTYPEMVSVYSVGPADATEADPKFAQAYSIEFCGGPHVTNTAELGEGGKIFKIKKEEASSAGVRRIKAVLE